MRAALYARVSDQEQVEGYSLDAQKRAFRAYVESQGWSVHKEYVDEGVSAHTDDVTMRPLFRLTIEDALAHKYDVLIVHKLDRFARNVRITLEYLDKLENVGVGFVSITEQMDFSTPIGRVILANLAAFGQYYSDNLSAEVKKGLGERAKQGLWVGPVPFGYIKGEDGNLQVVEEEAEVLSRVFEMYAAGTYTDDMIARHLNQSGHKPRSNRRDRNERDYIWTRDLARNLLRNAFYLGKVKHKGELLPGKHPAIVTQELFDTAMQMRKKHFIGPSTYSPNKRTYLLKGLLRCVDCGGKIWAENITGYEYYREENSARGIDCPNGRAYHRVQVFDDQVSKIIENLRLPESWRELVIEYLNLGDERRQTVHEQHRLEEKLKRIKHQYREGDIDQREYEREMGLTKSALAAVEPPVDAQLVVLGDHVEGLVEAWDAATKEERHQLLAMMLEAVYVDMKNAEVVGVKPKPEFLPLFNLRKPVKSGETILVTSEMDQGRSRPGTRAGRSCGRFLDWSQASHRVDRIVVPRTLTNK